MTLPAQHCKPQSDAAAPDPATGSRKGAGSPRPQTRPENPRASRALWPGSSPARPGRLVTWLARSNASVNRWLVREVAAAVPAPATVIELGCGPGVALAELLRLYPAAGLHTGIRTATRPDRTALRV